jgi:hypothetical protein
VYPNKEYFFNLIIHSAASLVNPSSLNFVLVVEDITEVVAVLVQNITDLVVVLV